MVRCEFCFELYDENIAHGVCPHCGYYEGYKQKDPRFLPIGCTVNDRYIVGGVIADGGFGITYRAWDTKLKAIMALKEYYQSGVVNRIPGTKDVFIAAPDRAEEFYYGEERLLREARIVSQFQTDIVVRVNDFFEENGTSYMVMEHLPYPTLQDYVLQRKQALSAEEVQKIGIQLCEALVEVHKAGVIHRDIAPDNIFVLPNGKIKIIDFGSARLSNDDTVENLILVKEGFSPDEQYQMIDLKNDVQKEWTDVYAVGATLYYAVTAVKPEESKIRKANVESHQPDMQEPIELNPTISENLNNTIMKAMAIDYHERFKDASEMLAALQDEVKVLPLPVTRKRKRLIRAAGIGGGLLVAAIIIATSALRTKIQYDEIVLDPAELTIWYSYTENNKDSVNQAMQDIKDSLKNGGEQFASVDIELQGFEESEYAEALEKAYKAGEMPDVYECVDLDAEYMADNYDSSVIVENLDNDTRSSWYVADSADEFKELGAVPIGFNVPVIYVNANFVSGYEEGTAICSMSDLLNLADEMEYKPIAIDENAKELFRENFNDFDEVYAQLQSVVTEEEFLDSAAAVYLSTTQSFIDVRNSGLNYKMAMVADNNIICDFSNYWAIASTTEADQKAAEVFVSYLYTDNAQTLYFVKDTELQVGGLPVNKDVVENCADLFWQLEDIFTGTDKYKFE